MASPIQVRRLRQEDLAEGDRILRLAFGTFLGMPEPLSFGADTSYVATRWRAAPSAAFAAEVDGILVGTNFATNWGSVGFFGPLTVRPDHWDRGVGRRLVEATEVLFTRWGTQLAGLYTFANSPKHLALYQRFGYRPRFLTAIVARKPGPARRPPRASWYSEAAPGDQAGLLAACRELTDAVYAGLDVVAEVQAVAAQGLGESVLLVNGSRVDGLAVCHVGPGTEAGSGSCYVKFAAVRPGDARAFEELLDACEALAASRGVARLAAGVNTARREAHELLLERGYRIELLGLAMHQPDEPGYSRPGLYVLDDWR